MTAYLLHNNKAVIILLFFIILTALPDCARPSPTSGPTIVDKPFNLTMKSYNFNTTLCWDYNLSSIIPYFCVEIKDFKSNDWIIVNSCRNILHQCCDVSEIIVEPYTYYNVKVKAYVGTKTSEYAEFQDFNLIDNGIIGPPNLTASVQDKMIVVDIWHPYVPFINGKKTVSDYFDDLTYTIYYGNETKEIDDCDENACTANILIAKLEGTYCVSAKGISDTNPMTFEQSKEICIDLVSSKEFSKQDVMIIASIFSALLVFAMFAICVFIKKTRTSAKVPKSLRAVVRNMTPRFTFFEPTTSYDHVCVSPPESPEEKTIETTDAKLDVNTSQHSVSGESVSGYHAYQSSLSETEHKSNADQDGSGEEETSSNTYSHTSNSNNGTIKSSITSESEKSESKQEPTRDVIPVPQSFGYDKPHVPLNEIIQMNKELDIEPKSAD